MALLWLGVCTQVWAVPALQEVKVNPLLADQLLLELSFSEPVSGFTDRLSYEPNQLLLHVPGAIGALTVNPLPIKQQGVDNLKGRGAGYQDSARSADPLSGPSTGQQIAGVFGREGRPTGGCDCGLPCCQSVGACQEPACYPACTD